jgi:hypothetical protein
VSSPKCGEKIESLHNKSLDISLTPYLFENFYGFSNIQLLGWAGYVVCIRTSEMRIIIEPRTEEGIDSLNALDIYGRVTLKCTLWKYDVWM